MDNKTTEVVSETRGFPLDILKKQDNPVMDVSIKMDVNFYSILTELSERFSYLDVIMKDPKLALNQKVELLNKSFPQNDLEIFANAIGTLIHSISNDQGDKGFIETRTAEDYEKIVEAEIQKRINDSKGTS